MAGSGISRLPRSIWALGLVSLFMDISSEMIHSLLPVFLVATLGASFSTVGLIEGVGEATASILRLYSGWLSDRLAKRKVLVVTGYALGALSKPLFALAGSSSWILFARFSDRVGKGIRTAPRDALVGDIAPADLRGAAYGLRQSLDTVGAFSGPLLAMLLMATLVDDIRTVFWLAVAPGVVAVIILLHAVREPVQETPGRHRPVAMRWRHLRALGRRFWGIVAVSGVLMLARFSEAFLVLRASEAGLPIALTPVVLVLMNVVYAASAYPLGALSDRVDRELLLGAGFAVLIVADLVLAAAPGIWMVMLGVGLWGLQMGMTQGLLSALVVDTAPVELRGTAFGLFHLALGVALLLGSLAAGLLWEMAGSSTTFLAGAACTLIGLLGAVALTERRNGG